MGLYNIFIFQGCTGAATGKKCDQCRPGYEKIGSGDCIRKAKLNCNADDVKSICKDVKLDLVFLIDGSDSITIGDFEKIKNWINKMIDTLEPSQLNTETLSVVTQYSDNVNIEVEEMFHNDWSNFATKVQNINQMAMGTNTFTALTYVSHTVMPRY